jgi:hypothetical protein
MTTTQPVMMNARTMASEVRLGTLSERVCILDMWSRDLSLGGDGSGRSRGAWDADVMSCAFLVEAAARRRLGFSGNGVGRVFESVRCDVSVWKHFK